MSAADNTLRVSGTSPKRLARVAGLFYLLTILTGMFAQGYVSERLVVWGDAAATARHLVEQRGLFEWGYSVYLVEMACDVVSTALLYLLLRPAGRSLALVAAWLGLTGCIIKTAGRVFFAIPLYLVAGGHAFHALGPDALAELALIFLKINDRAASMAMAFFGFYTVLEGILIIRSGFLPRLLGVLSILSGLGWLTMIAPTIGYRLFGYVLLVALPSSALMIFWLFAFGVNESRWRERETAGRAA